MPGEIADMMLEGVLCQICGEYLESDGDGFPVTCEACGGSGPIDNEEPIEVRKPFVCEKKGCTKRFKTIKDAVQHFTDKHEKRRGAMKRRLKRLGMLK